MDATESQQAAPLKKGLNAFELTATGVGIILGAGIYVIIGRAAGLSGGAIWAPFLIGALAAAFTGMSYAELSSMFPRAAASFEYTRRAFGLRIAFVVGWLMLFSQIISAAAVALGFGGYLTSFVGLGTVLMAVALILACSAVLIVGVRETVWMGVVFTAIETGGLLLVIFVSLRFIGDANYVEMPEGVGGLFRAATLIFFAYIGFEQITNLGEEARNPTKTMPLAIILAVALTTVLYVAVAIVSVSALDWRTLSQSEAPLADVVEAATGARASRVLSVIALFATANTVLFLLLTASRMAYGMASFGTLPGALARVHSKRRTPWVATLIAGAIAIAFALIGDIGAIAQLTNFAILVAFALVNAALIWLRYRRPEIPRAFRAPLNIGRFPLTGLFGIGFSIFMLANIELHVIGYGLLVAALGVVIPFLIRQFGRRADAVSAQDGDEASQ
ncbi:MAG: APC family permease [Chloroflexi bacterium]|nr:APC family permease [Chloroflexota bacterium]